MLIIPDRNIPRSRILLPMAQRYWRVPSHAQPKSRHGHESRTRFCLRARGRDGRIKWCGWFDDRDDADVFLHALTTGYLRYDRALWRLPTPWWDTDYEDLVYDFTTQVILIAGGGSTYTSPPDWSNSNNFIWCIGAGGGGAGGAGAVFAAGGGGGAAAKITNFVFAVPGTTTADYDSGKAGASGDSSATANGQPGGTAFFNDVTDPGAGSTNAKCSAKPGNGGTSSASSATGGAGGVGSSGWGQTLFSGGRGGNCSGTGTGASGGGGSAGIHGAGGNAADINSSLSNITSIGGTGDNGTVAAGAQGIEFDTNHGSAGGNTGISADPGPIDSTLDYLNYGSGGHGTRSDGGAIGSLGGVGIIVLNYSPAIPFDVESLCCFVMQ